MKDEYDEPEAHGTAPPRNAEEALARARNHARAAAAEAVAALHALLDAAALAGIGRPADTHRLLGPAAQILSQLARELGSGRISRVESLLVSVTRAVDDEITRWEQRARDAAVPIHKKLPASPKCRGSLAQPPFLRALACLPVHELGPC